MPRPTCVVIAHPARMIAAGIAAILQDDVRVAAVEHNVATAKGALLEHRPDVLVCDELLPGGLEELSRFIADMALPTNVLVIVETTLLGVRDCIRRLRAANVAVGVISHSSGAETVTTAVRTVATGGMYIDPELAGDLFAPKSHNLLSSREREILALLETGAANKAIALELDMSTETVKSHVSRILAKLEVPNRTAAIARANDLGLLRRSRFTRSPDRRPAHTSSIR